MQLFTAEQLIDFHQQQFAFLEIEEQDNVLTIRFDRAERRNALHPHMINEIGYALQYADSTASIWVVIIEAKGKVFCAGGDLKAMAGFVEPHDSTVPEPEEPILFNAMFSQLHKPLIIKVEGDVYAGGFMFLAGATFVVAADHIKLGLTEVKRGIYPMQVMAALLRVMPDRKVLDWCVRGYNLPVQQAHEYGLVTEVCPAAEVGERVTALIAELKQNSPTAIRFGLEAYANIRPSQDEQEYLLEMLGKVIGSKDGQEGLRAFREKRKPNWKGE
ncbi:MAG: enoyl-CoA hydratase-related protein [Saprospiraceae bacterium]